jgi:hypothetical protein
MANPKHGILNNQKAEISLDAGYDYVEVLARSGDAELWCVADAAAKGITDPSIIAVDGVDVIPATGGSVIIESNAGSNPTVVTLESTGAIAYSVKGLDA